MPFEDICLLELTRLRELYADRIKAIGFSGHHLGIAVDSAAVALGAEWIERHYTLDRTWKGTDHAASLEPDGVRKLVRDCKAVAKSLTYKKEEILDIEKIQRDKLKKHQVNGNSRIKMKTIAFIPVRGGSKSIPLKNIKLFVVNLWSVGILRPWRTVLW